MRDTLTIPFVKNNSVKDAERSAVSTDLSWKTLRVWHPAGKVPRVRGYGEIGWGEMWRDACENLCEILQEVREKDELVHQRAKGEKLRLPGARSAFQL